ncbi:MAG: Na/Pi cotransporter family protein [Paracoccaceae bacterium]
MTGGFLGFLGGIGLFLFGMETMTAALRQLAGERLRQWLLRMTSTPWRGVLTGAGITGIVQSSTAVTVMTIGFVGAGLIGFTQSLGVIYGANIGTTVTGWIVMLVGVKLKLGVVALPGLFIASLAGIFGDGRMARWGRMVAGLSLMFIGLDLMQSATAGIEGLLSPDRLPGDSWPGRLALVTIGFALVAVIQSSSAGVALAIVLLGSGAISFAQAASMLIGMNLGSTLTGVLASLGGSREMLRAAVANLLFNLGTAALAFPLLDLVLPLLESVDEGTRHQTALVLFHTGFNVVGTAVFLPLTRRFASLVTRLVPDRPVTLAEALDPRLLSDPGTALDAAARTAQIMAEDIGRSLRSALAVAPDRDLRPIAALPSRVDPARTKLEAWLAQIKLAPDQKTQIARMTALMHLMDHTSRLMARARELNRIAYLADSPRLARPARAVAAAVVLRRAPDKAARLVTLIRAFALRYRHGTLLREHAGMIEPADVFRETDALRWLSRVADHAERIAFYGAMARGPQPDPSLTPARPN